MFLATMNHINLFFKQSTGFGKKTVLFSGWELNVEIIRVHRLGNEWDSNILLLR